MPFGQHICRQRHASPAQPCASLFTGHPDARSADAKVQALRSSTGKQVLVGEGRVVGPIWVQPFRANEVFQLRDLGLHFLGPWCLREHQRKDLLVLLLW